MAYLDFTEFPDLLKYYTAIGSGTPINEEYTTFDSCTLLNDIKTFMYLKFSEDTLNQILHMLSTLMLWSKTIYTTIGQYPTLSDFLAIT